MTVTQIEALLKEATVEYLKTGENCAEVAYYARLLYVTTHNTKESN